MPKLRSLSKLFAQCIQRLDRLQLDSDHSDHEHDSAISSDSDYSDAPAVLNETLCIRTLLDSINLEEYAERMENAGVSLEQFLEMRLTDLQRFGVHSLGHCQKILNLIEAFEVEDIDEEEEME